VYEKYSTRQETVVLSVLQNLTRDSTPAFNVIQPREKNERVLWLFPGHFV
jgi:hypothetical protein